MRRKHIIPIAIFASYCAFQWNAWFSPDNGDPVKPIKAELNTIRLQSSFKDHCGITYKQPNTVLLTPSESKMSTEKEATNIANQLIETSLKPQLEEVFKTWAKGTNSNDPEQGIPSLIQPQTPFIEESVKPLILTFEQQVTDQIQENTDYQVIGFKIQPRLYPHCTLKTISHTPKTQRVEISQAL